MESIQALSEPETALWQVAMPLYEEFSMPERPFMSDTLLEQAKVSFSFVESE